MKNESDFLKELELRAQETHQLAGNWNGLEKYIKLFSGWLGINPWRVFIPISIATALFMMYLFRGYTVSLVSWMQALF